MKLKNMHSILKCLFTDINNWKSLYFDMFDRNSESTYVCSPTIKKDLYLLFYILDRPSGSVRASGFLPLLLLSLLLLLSDGF